MLRFGGLLPRGLHRGLLQLRRLLLSSFAEERSPRHPSRRSHPARHREVTMTTVPTVLFVCVHNAGRSQMAAGYLQELAWDAVEVLSAGSEPADRINPIAVAAMAEEGIDIAGNRPAVLTTDAVREADVVITMGCGDACPVFPGKRYEDWELTDPAGLDLDQVRPIRDEIRGRVERLLSEITSGV
jgi:protein-tyrosine-phosphatase